CYMPLESWYAGAITKIVVASWCFHSYVGVVVCSCFYSYNDIIICLALLVSPSFWSIANIYELSLRVKPSTSLSYVGVGKVKCFLSAYSVRAFPFEPSR
ncbi:19842_t:CDS:2, partial [Gigaspora rosea]